MKKLTLLLMLLSWNIALFAQSTPVSDLRVANATTAFGVNLPVGTKVYNIADGKYWVATTGVASSQTLTSGSTSFKQLNADGSSFVTLDQTTGQTIGTALKGLTQLYATDITVANPIAGSITGNAGTVTTNANLSGDVTSSGNTTTIADKAVSLTKMADMTTGILGNSTGGTPGVITLGGGLSFNGNTLTATGGTVTTVSVTPANGITGLVDNPTTTPAITLTLGDITPSSVISTGAVSGTSLSTAGSITSTVATGTAPFVVTSTTSVANLNIGGNATNVTGTVAVANGGTGLADLTADSYMIGAGSNVAFKTKSEVLTDIGAASAASASLFKVQAFSEALDGAQGQVNTLAFTPKTGTSIQVTLNGSALSASQYSVSGKDIQITIPVYQYDAVTISYGY